MKKIYKKYLLISSLILGTLFISIPTVILVSKKINTKRTINSLPFMVVEPLNIDIYDDLIESKLVENKGFVNIYNTKEVSPLDTLYEFNKLSKLLNLDNNWLNNQISELINTVNFETYSYDTDFIKSLYLSEENNKLNLYKLDKNIEKFWNYELCIFEFFPYSENNLDYIVTMSSRIYNFFIDKHIDKFKDKYNFARYAEYVLNNFNLDKTDDWIIIECLYTIINSKSNFKLKIDEIKKWLDQKIDILINTDLHYSEIILKFFYNENWENILKEKLSKISEITLLEKYPNWIYDYMILFNDGKSNDLLIKYMKNNQNWLYSWYTFSSLNIYFSLCMTKNSEIYYSKISNSIKNNINELINNNNDYQNIKNLIEMYFYIKIIYKYDKNFLSMNLSKIIEKLNDWMKYNHSNTAYLYALKSLNILANENETAYIYNEQLELVDENIDNFNLNTNNISIDYAVNLMLIAKLVGSNKYDELKDKVLKNKEIFTKSTIELSTFYELKENIKMLNLNTEFSDVLNYYDDMFINNISENSDKPIEIYFINNI